MSPTGRMSIKDPSMQQIHIKTPEGRKIKDALSNGADPEFIDYTWIENRILSNTKPPRKATPMSPLTTTWKTLIADAKGKAGDESAETAVRPADVDLDKEFYVGFGGAEAEPFMMWTEDFVYFAAVKFGEVQVEFVPRSPRECEVRIVGSSE